MRVSLKCHPVKKHEADGCQRRGTTEVFKNGGEGDVGCLVKRVSIGAGADGGEGDACKLARGCKGERFCIGAGEQGRLPVRASMPYRPDGVDDMPGRQIAAAGNDCIPGGAPADLFTLLQYGGTAGTVNSPVYAPSAKQGGVGGVDDGINLLKGNISFYQLKHGSTNGYFHEHLTSVWTRIKISCFRVRVKTAARSKESSRCCKAG
jgi:hypothetical protein